MTVLIVSNDYFQTHILRYDTDDSHVAKNLFLSDWSEGRIEWDSFEYYGPGCSVENPAFTPDFVRGLMPFDEPYEVIEKVHVWTWWCITGIHGSDEHYVTGYFVNHVVDMIYDITGN
ncbi:MAG: hypothetical protein ABJA02_01700 [Acidobacteriota bacterium]